MNMMKKRIILASASPRRREILANIGWQIAQTVATNIDETPYPNENVRDYVLRMALEKNAAAKAQIGACEWPILSADTSVVLDGGILGKPIDAADAAAMLRRLSGRVHQVMTAVAVSCGDECVSCVQNSEVQFKTLTEKEISDYIASGEPMDKAGAYGIQGLGGVFVAHLSGSFSGVMGLPVFETADLLRRLRVDV